MHYPIGKTYFNLRATMTPSQKRIRSELYIRGPNAKNHFQLLIEQRDAIEQELGYSLEWNELSDGKDSRITVYQNDVDPEDEKTWSCQHEWLATKLNDMHRVFANRIQKLNSEK